MNVLLICIIAIAPISARKGFGPGEQEWGNVTVRPQAHMFWWLHYTSANVTNFTERPLIIWVEGGPGGSGTGFGNFALLGTLDFNLKPRNHTWVKNANVLFVDGPVGVGWSHIDNQSALATTNKQIADDFLVLLQGFYKAQPEFETVPMYIMSESYGGKMGAEIALVLDKAIKERKIEANFLGVGLGAAAISPIDLNLCFAPFLFYVGAIDSGGYHKIMASARKSKALFDAGKFYESTQEYLHVRDIAKIESHDVNIYNVLYTVYTETNELQQVSDVSEIEERIGKLMNGPVKRALNLNDTWKPTEKKILEALKEDFMKPVDYIVEKLLNRTNVRVAVYSGQLDAIVSTLSTTSWVDKLRWTKSKQWPATPRKVLSVNNINEGYVKKLGNLALYWINRAGHFIPSDNPNAMDALLRQLTDNYKGSISTQV